MIRCATEADTLSAGRNLGGRLAAGDLVLLTGPLGAGKTVLVRGIAAGLGIDPELVRSPTFVLHHVYGPGRVTLHHMDLYRLGAGADVRFLDIDELLDRDAVVIEWGEHATGISPGACHISIEVGDDGVRLLRVGGAVPERIAMLWSEATPA